MSGRLIAVATAVTMIAGCASPVPLIDFYSADSGALRHYRDLDVVGRDAEAALLYDDLGVAQGLYCNRTRASAADSGDARRHAIDQVKLRAAGMGADAISVPECEVRTSWDLTNNCYATLTCRSRALALDRDQAKVATSRSATADTDARFIPSEL